MAALFQRFLLPKKLCDLSFVCSKLDFSEILEFLNPAQCRLPSGQAGRLCSTWEIRRSSWSRRSVSRAISSARRRRFSRSSQPRTKYRGSATLSRLSFFVSHPAKLDVPAASHRQAIGCLELVQRIAAEEIETLFQLGLDPRKQTMTVAEGQFAEERLAMERSIPTR